MVIWLRSPRSGVAVGQDVLRASDVVQLIELDRASEQAERYAEDVLAGANEDADAIRREAEQEAGRVLKAARIEYEQAERLGYEAGLERALQEAHATMLRGAASEHALLIAMQKRLADIVMRTAARVLGDADRDALFTQIAANLSRDLDQSSFLTVRVAPADLNAATRAFRRVCEEHRWPLNPALAADPDAAPGSCVCEWDHGVVEAGLPLQLSALERAIRSVIEGDEEGAVDCDDSDQALLTDDEAEPASLPDDEAEQGPYLDDGAELEWSEASEHAGALS